MKRSGSLRLVAWSVMLLATATVAIEFRLWREGASAQGAEVTFTVDTDLDTVDANPGDGVCADSAGRCSLRASVMEANALMRDASSGVSQIEIRVPPGTYELTIEGPPSDQLDPDVDERGGDLDIYAAPRQGTLRLVGAGASQTTLRGRGDRVINVENREGGDWPPPTPSPTPTPTAWFAVEIRDLRVSEGFAAAQTEPWLGPREGGGIRVAREAGGRTVIDRVVVARNRALRGGGIYTRGETEIVDTAVVDNEATDDAIPAGYSCEDFGAPGGGGIDASQG